LLYEWAARSIAAPDRGVTIHWRRRPAEIRDGYWAIFDTDGLTTQPGPELVELIDHRIGEFIDRYRATYPAAMKILDTDRAGLTANLVVVAQFSAASPLRSSATGWRWNCSSWSRP
jgi:hypothetical protein